MFLVVGTLRTWQSTRPVSDRILTVLKFAVPLIKTGGSNCEIPQHYNRADSKPSTG